MSVDKKVIDYAVRYQQAVLGMMRDLFEEVSEEGLPSGSSFYVTFATEREGVELSPILREHYPEQMTIVLQNQFWGLTVDEDAFSVTLRFGGAPETLRVPWLSLMSFADPSAEFGLEFGPGRGSDSGQRRDTGEEGEEDIVDAGGEVEAVEASNAAEVLSFEDFKKR